MMQFTNNVIIPYVKDIRETLPLTVVNKLLGLLKENDIVPLFVPAAYTDKLQT